MKNGYCVATQRACGSCDHCLAARVRTSVNFQNIRAVPFEIGTKQLYVSKETYATSCQDYLTALKRKPLDIVLKILHNLEREWSTTEQLLSKQPPAEPVRPAWSFTRSNSPLSSFGLVLVGNKQELKDEASASHFARSFSTHQLPTQR